jgi:hypothetical protein
MCGSRSARYLGSGGDPQSVRLVALAVEFEHSPHEIFHTAAPLGDGAEVLEVLLAGFEILGRSSAPTLLCPDTTTFGFRAATLLMLSIHS